MFTLDRCFAQTVINSIEDQASPAIQASSCPYLVLGMKRGKLFSTLLFFFIEYIGKIFEIWEGRPRNKHFSCKKKNPYKNGEVNTVKINANLL